MSNDSIAEAKLFDDLSRTKPEAETIDSYEELARLSSPINYTRQPFRFVQSIFNNHTKGNPEWKTNRTELAALFDLAVTACYMEKIADNNWIYCRHPGGASFNHPFVNACPTCILNDEFIYSKAHKPRSASIGKYSSDILAAFLDLTIKEAHPRQNIRILRNNGLVDAYLEGDKSLVLFEIKSAPLIPFPVTANTTPPSEAHEDLNTHWELANHSEAAVRQDIETFLIIDKTLRIPTGKPRDYEAGAHYDAIANWLETGSNRSNYINSWKRTYDGYHDSSLRNATYWLTNGCGRPDPRPVEWPRTGSNGGYSSISDGKSSVGMDRTDDLKKGLYQVLKISNHYKEHFPSGNKEVFVALASNIHAVKHGAEYVDKLANIVWTTDEADDSYVAKNSDGSFNVKAGKLYNLFDAIITFTDSHFRSDYLEDLYG